MLFLVVDDDVLSRDLLTLVLESEGYEAQTAASGEAAVAQIAASAQEGRPSPKVVLSDIQMPGLSGSSLATALREALGDDALLLAMSGSQPPESALAGFDGFLLKPFKVSDLRAMVERVKVDPASPTQTPGLDIEPELADKTGMQIEEGGPAALDEDIYSKLCELMPVEQLGQMYALCVEDARKRIAHMRVLAEAGDDEQYRREAHSVKGGAGMIGASELHELAAAAERSGLQLPETNSGTTTVTASLDQLSRSCDRLERILAERTQE